MNVEIITIGDELLIGQVVDTNSAWMGEQLSKEGFRVVWRTAVGDVRSAIMQALDEACQRADVVLLTGGIGPTRDDITRATLCAYFQSKLVFSEEVFRSIERLLQRSGREMNELTRDQAMVPDNCLVIPNETGTAPCTWFDRNDIVVVSMPGVPYEMKWLMTEKVIPRLKERFIQDTFIRFHTYWVTGYTESALALKLNSFEDELPEEVTLAYLPQPGVIRLRLSVCTDSPERTEQLLTVQKEKLKRLLETSIIGENASAIEQILGEILNSRQLLLGTAESCTGGRIASMITSWPGCSSHFTGSVVSYSNEVKKNVLGVSAVDLEKEGAVSQPVVEQMARGAMERLGCDCAVATSGIAGPDGGTPEKPVGTVWIAAAYRDKVHSKCYHFGINREQNIQRASNTALLMLIHLLKE